jgi:hypothetical protein
VQNVAAEIRTAGESGAPTVTEMPFPRNPLMARPAICALQLVTCSPSPSTVPPPLISTSGPSALTSPKNAVCVDPST